jgi:formate C-acetyltransferase
MEVVGNMKKGIPFFFNDDVMIPSLTAAGIPLRDARGYTQIGCVETVIPGKSNPHAVSGELNLLKAMEYAIGNGESMLNPGGGDDAGVDANIRGGNDAGVDANERGGDDAGVDAIIRGGDDAGVNANIRGGITLGIRTGDPLYWSNYGDAEKAVFEQMDYLLDACCRMVSEEADRGRMDAKPYKSALTQGCVESGRDFNDRGALYDCYRIMLEGIPNRADSLAAIRHLVFGAKRYSMEQLLSALRDDFPDEAVRLDFIYKAAKFGNDIEEVDLLAGKISEDSAHIIHEFDNSPFRPYMIAREGLAWHYFGGLGVGALPNGRKALEPLNDGSLSPMRGADKKGPTAALRSALTAGFRESHASVLNQKFSSAILRNAENVDKLAAYTNAFMSGGGSHIQYNMLDTNELRDAKVNPDNYRDLIVRIGGFSAYFTQLSPDIQDDVINRSEHNL